MATEDDTFEALRRLSYDEIDKRYTEWERSRPGRAATERVAFMKRYYWTWLEYFNETARRNGWDGIKN